MGLSFVWNANGISVCTIYRAFFVIKENGKTCVYSEVCVQSVFACAVLTCNFLPSLNLESDIEDILRSLRSQNILTEVFNGSDYSAHHTIALNGSDYVSVAPHSAAINVFHRDNVSKVP